MKLFILTALAVCGPAVPASASQEADFQSASGGIQDQRQAAVERLAQLREDVANSLLPLSQRLRKLEGQSSAARTRFNDVKRKLDGSVVELDNLEFSVKRGAADTNGLTNTLSGYASNFDSRVHIAERELYKPLIDAATAAANAPDATPAEVFALQADIVDASFERIEEALGGRLFAGTAVDAGGLVERGTFAVFGPIAVFRSETGTKVGTVEQPVNSYEPTLQPFADPVLAEAAGGLVATGSGRLPTDPTLGNAHKLADTEETVLEEIQKGGLVIIPIFVMAGIALAMALYRWVGLTLTRMPSRKKVTALLDAVGQRDSDQAEVVARSMRGPAGKMLTAGAEHLGEPTELIEEVMYERLLTTKIKLNAMLPFIAICAASAPLLGLLGTVTGIIRTFQLITLYGSGDVKTLSGGISEALITTKYGLVVAIPSLLLHAFLSRKARGISARMETLAMGFVNRVGVSYRAHGNLKETSLQPAPDPKLVRDQVQAILGEMLGEDARVSGDPVGSTATGAN